MSDRRSFLGAVSGAAASLLMTSSAAAEEPSPAPRASASPKPPSAAARAQAATMRAFDPALTDAQLETIAKAIDDNDKAGRTLNPRGRALRNADEPVTQLHLAQVR